jgi:hypothetical protein
MSVYSQDRGIGYMLATGKVFCPLDEFHAFAEELLGRPVMTHEFASQLTWAEMRDRFEEQAVDALSPQTLRGAGETDGRGSATKGES